MIAANGSCSRRRPLSRRVHRVHAWSTEHFRLSTWRANRPCCQAQRQAANWEAQVIEIAALTLAAVAGFYLVSLGGVSLVAPSRASRFLLGFAGSQPKHYAELMIRLLAGGAFVLAAPGVVASWAFTVFGWLLLATTVCLLFIPWQWHHRFASRGVPEALRFLPIIGICSLALGAFVLWAVVRGNAA